MSNGDKHVYHAEDGYNDEPKLKLLPEQDRRKMYVQWDNQYRKPALMNGEDPKMTFEQLVKSRGYYLAGSK